MIIKVKVPQGVKVSGTLTKPGEHKTLGNKPVFILNVEAASEKRDGRWESYYVDVKIWGEHPEMEDMSKRNIWGWPRGPPIIEMITCFQWISWYTYL